MRGILSALTALGLLVACTEEPNPSRGEGEHQVTSPTLEESANLNRATFLQVVDEQLAAIDRDLAELEARVSRAGSAVQEEIQEAVQRLPEQRDALQQKLMDIKASAASASEDVRDDIVQSCQRLKDALKNALEKVS
jgi:hypothetical protein